MLTESKPAEVIIPETWSRYLLPTRGEEGKKPKFATPKAAHKAILKGLKTATKYRGGQEHAISLLESGGELDNDDLASIGVALHEAYGARSAQRAWVDWALHNWEFNEVLEQVLSNAKKSDDRGFRRGDNDGFFLALRTHLAVIDEEKYSAAKALASSYFSANNPELSVRLLFLFPEEREWQEELLKHTTYAQIPWFIASLQDLDIAKALIKKASLHAFNPGWMPNLFAQFFKVFGLEAAPLLADLVQRSYIDADSARQAGKALACLPHRDAYLALLDMTESNKSASESLQLATEQFPVIALECLTEKESKPALIKGLLKRHPDVIERASLSPAQQAFLEKQTAASASDVPEAPKADWPELLREPRWLNPKTFKAPTLKLDELTHQATIDWKDGEKQKWARPEPAEVKDVPLKEYFKGMAGWETSEVHAFKHLLKCGPTAAQELLDNVNEFDSWYMEDYAKGVVARWELKALPLLQRMASSKLADSIAYIAPYNDTELCRRAAEAYSRLKSVRRPALAYLKRYPETAATALIPDLLSKKKKQKSFAQAAIMSLNQSGFGAQLKAVAAKYGEETAKALEPLWEMDDLDNLPAKMPEIPGWLHVGSLKPPVLKNGGALPEEALENFVLMLALSKPGEPYPGVAIVAEYCDPKSLADFAWSLYELWTDAGAESKYYWAFHALGLMGNDEIVRKLTPLLKKWPGEGAHARAVQGLDVLTTIGTDIALMHLFGLSQKLKFKGLKNQAGEKVKEIAENRGLTTDELGDRLVPDLGLDSTGSLELNYGPRKFFVIFDEKLKPLVKDEAGKEKKNLPKPGKSDDPEISKESFDRFKALKKDARTVASQQLVRMESAMVKQRRWATTDFESFFLNHPLVINLVRRLIWGVYDENGLKECFRVAEDGSLADVEDDEWSLPTEGEIGLVHPFDLDDKQRAAWSELLADYMVLQPFPQLDRLVFRLKDDEKDESTLTRFDGVKTQSVRVLSLESKGWRKGEALDGGVVGWMLKDLGDGTEASLDLDMGLVIGDPTAFPEQTLRGITIHEEGRSWDSTGGLKLGSVPETAMSEILRDMDVFVNSGG